MAQLFIPNPANAGKIIAVSDVSKSDAPPKRPAARVVVTRKIRRAMQRQAKQARARQVARRIQQAHVCEPIERPERRDKIGKPIHHPYQYCKYCGRAMKEYPTKREEELAAGSATGSVEPTSNAEEPMELVSGAESAANDEMDETVAPLTTETAE